MIITAIVADNNNVTEGMTPITNMEMPNNNGVNTPNTDNQMTCLAIEISKATNGKMSTRDMIPSGNQLNINESVMYDKNIRLLEFSNETE